MAHLDVFKADAFSESELTTAINHMPYVPGQIGQAGIFTSHPVRTTVVEVERRDNTFSLIPFSPRGSEPHQNKKDLRNVKNFKLAHMAMEDAINADEVQNIRAFGSESELDAVMNEVSLRQARIARSFDATEEHMMLGSLRGEFIDADGSTILDYFTEFGVPSPTPVDFDLANITDLRSFIAQSVIRPMQYALGAEAASGIICFCGPAFMDGLVDNPDVKAALERADVGHASREYAFGQFSYAGVTFQEYRNINGTNTDFIGTNEALFVPQGTSYFKKYYGPADYLSAVNTLGLPRYSRVHVDPKERYVEVEAQSNPLVLCEKPEVLIPATTTS